MATSATIACRGLFIMDRIMTKACAFGYLACTSSTWFRYGVSPSVYLLCFVDSSFSLTLHFCGGFKSLGALLRGLLSLILTCVRDAIILFSTFFGFLLPTSTQQNGVLSACGMFLPPFMKLSVSIAWGQLRPSRSRVVIVDLSLVVREVSNVSTVGCVLHLLLLPLHHTPLE